jgi:hypothetical protein
MKIYIFKKPMERFRTALYESFLEISEKEIDEMSQSVRFLESDEGEESISLMNWKILFLHCLGFLASSLKRGLYLYSG